MEIFKDFSFDSAHFLPYVPEDHKCRRMHGHTYRVRIAVRGKLDPKLGWVMDFTQIKQAWKPLERQLDHRVLNEIEGLENPTAEYLAVWIWQKLDPELPGLSRVEVYETPTSGVIYQGEAI